LSKNGLETSVRVQGPIRSNDGELLCQAAQDGLGLIRASELVVLSELRSGKLTQVLADYEVGSNAAVWALYPSSKHLLPRMRALLDFLGVWFRDLAAGQNGPALTASDLAAVAEVHPPAPAG
jgi:DNA-binding transcriptional LysR family regulator